MQKFPGSPNQFDDDAGDVVLQGSRLTLAYDLADNPVNGTWTPLFRVTDGLQLRARLNLSLVGK